MPQPRLLLRHLPFLLAVATALAGLAATAFFCDDAFINFRYSCNAFDGHGLVWNPPPWLPVEGYTSFGWVAGLWLVQLLTTVPPPSAAIPITATAGVVLLWAVHQRLLRWATPPALHTAVLLGIAGNHSFATWLSSGMETMVYAAVVLGWTFAATAPPPNGRPRLFTLCCWATLAHIMRPDGDLLVLATLAVLGHAVLVRAASLRMALLAASPFVLVGAHVVGRRLFYGAWQPNTFYAKVVTAWPESGLRYLYCFAVENGCYLSLPVVVVLGGWLLRRHGVRPLFGAWFPALAAVGTWLAHTGYYTLVVGGDHFAYRVFVQLVPFTLVALAAVLLAANVRRGVAAAIAWLVVLVSVLPGWWMERALVGREASGFVRAAPTVPAVLRPLLRDYDRAQAWLHVHSVGFRRATHALFCGLARQDLPERRAGWIAGSLPGQRLVYRADAVGVVGWALADVAIVDGHGLNDWVIARSRQPAPAVPFDPAALRAAFPTFDRNGDGALDRGEVAATTHLLASIGPALAADVWVDVLLALGDEDHDERLQVAELVQATAQLLPPRQMAHERLPPPGYIEALRCNVDDTQSPRRVRTDVVPLSDDELRAIEVEWRARVAK